MTAEPALEMPPGVDFAIDEPGDAPPKRRRGRPPGSTTRRASGDRAPRRNSRTWVRQQCATLVGIVNMALASHPLSRADALNEPEMDALADALTAECMSSDRILGWLGRASGMSAHVLMIQCIIMIAMPRLQRRGMLPGGSRADETSAPADSTPVPMAPGRAPGVSWQDGQWKNDAGIGAIGGA